MAYVVTKTFRDKEDNENLCRDGEQYPREGLEVSEERLGYLVEQGAIALLDGAEGKLSVPEDGQGKEPEDDLTADEIKAKLDELGIKYSSRAGKDKLKALLDGAEGE